MCIYNTMIKNPKYKKNKKNGGRVPSVIDRRIEWIPAGCGNCIECRKQKAREWQLRLTEDIKENKNGKFITLTFSNESIIELNEQFIKKKIGENTIYNIKTRLPKIIPTYEIFQIKELKGYEHDNQIATKAVRMFTGRWRKKYKENIRHWLITELGHNGTENIHLHGIIWTDKTYEEIHNRWKYGFIWPRPENKTKTWVNSRTVNYIIKYVSKMDFKHKEYKPKILNSDGIGANYINEYNIKRHEYKGANTITTYKSETGHNISLPIYWRNKIYHETERERLWIQQLDKEVRYIRGQKIDVSKGMAEYLKIQQSAREYNQRLGYGGRPNENRKYYEEQIRDIKTMTRIQKAKKKEPPAE